MALTATFLSASMDALTLDFNVAAIAGATVGGFVRIDGEFAVITAILAGSGGAGKVTVRSRGDNGGTAVAHDVLAPVTFGLMTDQATLGVTEGIPVPTQEENLATLGQNNPIAVPNRNTTYLITKTTALGGSTMPNPSLSQDGLEVAFLSNTAFAHVVNLVTSDAGVTGGNKTIYTFAAFAGAGFRVKAIKGRWLAISLNGVTPT
jgi:hypothetical protein